MNREKPNAQQAVCCNAGCMPAESPVGLSSVHARANICAPPHYSKPPTVSGKAMTTQPDRQIGFFLIFCILVIA